MGDTFLTRFASPADDRIRESKVPPPNKPVLLAALASSVHQRPFRDRELVDTVEI